MKNRKTYKYEVTYSTQLIRGTIYIEMPFPLDTRTAFNIVIDRIKVDNNLDKSVGLIIDFIWPINGSEEAVKIILDELGYREYEMP